jgi:hypothetical protein
MNALFRLTCRCVAGPVMRADVAITAALATTIVAAGGCGGNAKEASASPPQDVTVAASDYKLDTTGLTSLTAGFVRFTVRNEGEGEHALLVARLPRPATRQELQKLLQSDTPSKSVKLYGGIQGVPPGRHWQMIARLNPGNYAAVDFGENGGKPNFARGMFEPFRVQTATGSHTAPPKTIGSIQMKDFSFAIHLPKRFSGKGYVQIPNQGAQEHEISLVRIQGTHSAQEVLHLIESGTQQPPSWAKIVELLAVLSPGRAAYVNFDLEPGRYVALCLIDDPGSHKLHAQLGMVGEFTVAGA